MQRQETAILIASGILIMLIGIIIFLFLIFQRRKNSLLLSQKEKEKRFEQEIAETQIEIREETLRNISWELHDNIGQLLTLAKIQINVAQDDRNRLGEVTETISKSLTELRALSKLINPDMIKNLSLPEVIGLEIERFNRLQFIDAQLNIKGEEFLIDSKAEIIIFRIIQEFFTNTIKHSQASKLEVSLCYKEQEIEIIAQDNGVGFDIQKIPVKKGLGLCNIKNRGKLINAEISLNSQKEKGTILKLTYTPQLKTIADAIV